MSYLAALAAALPAPHEEHGILCRLEEVYRQLGRDADEKACRVRREAVAPVPATN